MPEEKAEKRKLFLDKTTNELMMKHPLILKRPLGKFEKLAGCCGVWHFHSFTVHFKISGLEKEVVAWLEKALEEEEGTIQAGLAVEKKRGMVLLTLSDQEGWRDLREALEDSEAGWEGKKFWNPATHHYIYLFTLTLPPPEKENA